MAKSLLTGGLFALLFTPPEEEDPIRFMRYSVLVRHANGKLYTGHVVTALDPKDWADMHGHIMLKAHHAREAGPFERTKLL